jgi:TolA-binding protein
MKVACPRLFEVEALRDGRLTGAELTRFQSHLGVCSVCAREAQALQALAEALRSPTNLADTDQLHVRRERTRLLAAFDASLVPAPRSSRAKLWLGSAAAVAVLAALAFVLWPARRAAFSPSAARATAPEPVIIRADSSAKWSRRVEKQLDEIVLQSGALSIRVDHTASQRRLLVILPDGELEDIGTTFSVSADAGHTTRVTVQDGSVVLRLHGKPPLALGAGDSWSSPSAPATPPPSSAPPPAHVPQGVKSATSAATATATSAAPALDDTPDLDASADFRAAMSAFDSGDNARAAARFTAFLTKHARDAHAEDAAYLRVLAVQRTGNSVATQQAARDYLARYPHGFRHAEIEALSR